MFKLGIGNDKEYPTNEMVLGLKGQRSVLGYVMGLNSLSAFWLLILIQQLALIFHRQTESNTRAVKSFGCYNSFVDDSW